ncbi:MAG: class C beta-lactamase [Rhodanobacteraceae bacterium]
MAKSLALLALLLAASAVVPSAGRAAAPERAKVQRIVDGVIPRLMQADAIPGMAVGLIVAGRPYVFNYGVASRASGAPVADNTLFELGSVSKTFTATLAALAQADGRLSLRDPVSRFLPVLKDSPFGGVSLLELGTHTPGGLPLQVPDSIRDEAGLMRYLEAWKPACVPGTCRTYSNISVGLLGLITAKSEGKPFTTLMRQQVLVPLGMHDTWYAVPDDRMARYAEGYTTKDRPIRMVPGMLDVEANGIRTTAGDMVRWLQANLGPDTLDARLRQAITTTHTGYFTAGPITQDLIWEQYPYPVALKTLLAGNSPRMIFDSVPATRLAPPRAPQRDVWINKTGSTNGFGAYVAFIPAKGMGIVILANKSYPITDRVRAAYRILSELGSAR